jgi:Uma2 family endonuclease
MTVAMDQIPRRLTWEAFVELPEELLRLAELHDGEVVEMASPDRPHQLTLVNLILSASTRRKDLLRKPTHYFSVGVEELWLVDCGERVFHVLHPNGDYHEWVDGDVALSPLLPDFEVAVTDLISQVS